MERHTITFGYAQVAVGGWWLPAHWKLTHNLISDVM